jgi:hypothetical protein
VASELRLTFALDHHHIISCHFVHSYNVALLSTLFSTLAFYCMMHIMFKTLFVKKKKYTYLPKPSYQTTLEPRPTKGGIDLCQVDKVYLYPFSKILNRLILNP